MAVDQSTLTPAEIDTILLATVSTTYLNKKVLPLDRIATPTLNYFHKGSARSTPIQGGYKCLVKGERNMPFQAWSGRDLLTFAGEDVMFDLEYYIGRVHLGDEWIHQQLQDAGIKVKYDSSNGTTPTKLSSKAWEVVVNIATEKLEDMENAYRMALNRAIWTDNSANPKMFLGIPNMISDDPTTGTIGGKSRANPLLRHHVRQVTSIDTIELQTSQFVRAGNKRNGADGSKFDYIAAGETYYDMLADLYLGTSTRPGKFDRNMSSDKAQAMAEKWGIGLNSEAFYVTGVGIINLEPVFEDLDALYPALSIPYQKRAYFFNSKHIKLIPTDGIDNEVLVHPTPYNQRLTRISRHGEYAFVVDKPNSHGMMYLS